MNFMKENYNLHIKVTKYVFFSLKYDISITAILVTFNRKKIFKLIKICTKYQSQQD